MLPSARARLRRFCFPAGLLLFFLCANVVAATADFSYTGEEQTFTAPRAGTYKLEVWGAQGGGTNGGKGGYASGTITLAANQTIRVYVGGKPTGTAGGYLKAGKGTTYGGGGLSYISNYQYVEPTQVIPVGSQFVASAAGSYSYTIGPASSTSVSITLLISKSNHGTGCVRIYLQKNGVDVSEIDYGSSISSDVTKTVYGSGQVGDVWGIRAVARTGHSPMVVDITLKSLLTGLVSQSGETFSSGSPPLIVAGGGGGQGSSTSYAGSPSGTNYNSSKKLYGADASSGGGGGSGYYGGNGGSGGAGGGGGTCYTGGVSNGTTTQGERSGHGFARITYDTTPPNQTSTALTTIDWTSVNANAAGTRSWTAATDVGTGLDVSGVKGYNVRWNGSTTYQTGTSYTPAALSAAGIYNLEIQTVDNAGNTSAYKTILTYKYDPNAPGQSSTGLTTVDWTNVNADAAGARTWTAATDIGTVGTNASGIKGYNVRWNGATTFQTGTSYTPTALTAAGIYNLEIQTVDNAGNTSAYKTILTYKYDPDAPNQTGTALTTVEWTSANVSAMNTQTWTAATDAGTVGTDASGVRGYNVRWNGTTTFQTGTLFTPTALTAAGIYNLEIQTVDNAGNTSAFKTILIYKFDNDIPGKKAMRLRVASVIGTIGWTSQNAYEFIWDPVTDLSGIDHYEIYWGTEEGGTNITWQTNATTTRYNVTNIADSGIYYFRVRAVDTAANFGEWKTVATYKFDKDAPGQTATDLGVLGWTDQDSHTFNWDPVADLSGIEHYDIHWSAAEGTSVTHTTAGTAYTVSGLSASGTYYLRVRAVDNAGNIGAWKTIAKYKYDNTAPAQTLTGLTSVEWTSKNAGASVPRTWAEATDDASGIKGYNVRWNGTTAFQTGTSYTPTALTVAGIYNLEVQTVDNTGNTGAFKTILTYKYDPTPPDQTSTGLTIVEWTNANASAAGVMTWAAAADQGAVDVNASGIKGYNVRWNGTTAYQTGTSYTPTALTAAGTYNLEIQTVDNAGNVSEFKPILTYKYDPDVPEQTVTDLGVLGWTNQGSYTFNWEPVADPNGIGHYDIHWSVAEGDSVTYQTAGTAYTANGLSGSGEYYLRVRAVDNAGNVGAWKTIVRYKYDDTAPAQTPTNLITVEWTSKNAGAAIPRTWAAATDDASGIKGYNVRWHNGTPVFQTGTSYTPTALTVAGIYNLEVQTVDNAGNVSDYKTILTYEYDPNAPGQTDTSLTIVEWTSKNASAAGARSWTAADAGTLGVNASGIKGYNVRWNGITTFQTDASYYMPTALSAAGIYNLEVQTVDKADNVSDYKTILTYKYDPDAPRQTVTDLGVLDWTNQSMHIFNWDPVTDLSGIDHYDIHWSATEGTSVTHQTAGAAYTASGLSAGGTYYLRVRTVDGAGNTGVWKTIAKYKYDGAAPDFAPERTTVSWTTQKDCGLVTWTAANDGSGSGVAGYNIYWGKAADGTVVLAHQNGNGAAARGYNPLPCDTGDGVYYLRVQAVDNAGNVSVWKTVLAYQYDAGAPVLPFTNTETEFSADVDRGEFYWNAADDGAGSGVKGYYVYWGVNPNGASANLQTTPAFDPPPCEEYTYYYLRVQAVDNIGNAGEWKTLLSYAFNSSDKPGISMTSKVIGWTKDAKPPSITWASAQTGGPVISGYYVYWGQDSEGRNPDNFREGNGTYDRTYNPPACSADGYWYLRVQAQNAAGNKGIWSTVLTYKYDAAPPGSSPTLPDTDIDWSGSKHPEPFTWEPASDGRGSGVAGYQIYWGLQSSGVSANYYTESNTFVIPELAADGKYYLRVRAIDAAGNTGNWTTVYRYWHDGSAPVFVAKTETVDWTTSPDPPVFNWDEALDGVIGENAGSGVAGYNLYWGDDPDGSAVMLQRSRDNRQYDPPPCGSGDPHYLRIQAVDNVGNTSEWQTVLVYHYDGLPPGISPTEVTVPETNNPYPGIFDWTEADDGLGSGVNGYYVYWGAQPDGEDNSTAAYQHGADKNSFEPPKITNGTGTYYLRVKARDNMGNIGDWTTVLTYHYRYTRPGISATSETTSWTNTADPPPFEWQAVTEAPSGVSGYNIYWGDDSDGMATITTCPKNDRTFDPPPVQKPGLYYLRVQAVDGFGAPGDWATVYVYHYENTPPSGGIMISSDNSEYTLTGNVVLYLNYTDEHSGVAAMNIKLGEDWQGWEAAAPVKTVELPAGDSEKTVSVRYQDAAGNISPEYTASISPNTVPEAASPYIQGSGGTGEKVWSYPNPFSPDNGQAARLAYIVERDGWTRVYVYDARGRRVWQTESFARAGQDNIVLWDGRNNRGQLASNGLYIIIVTTEKNQIISRGRLTLYDE